MSDVKFTMNLTCANVMPRQNVEALLHKLVAAMKDMDDFDREDIFYHLGTHYCRHCGCELSETPPAKSFCCCNNDE